MKKLSTLVLVSALSLAALSPVYAQESESSVAEPAIEEVSLESEVATDTVVGETEAPIQYSVTDSSSRPFVFNEAEITPLPWGEVENAQAITQEVDGIMDLNIEWGRISTDLYSSDGILYEAGTPVFRVVSWETQQNEDFALYGSLDYPISTSYGKVASQYVTVEGYTYIDNYDSTQYEMFKQADAFKSAVLENTQERLHAKPEAQLPALDALPVFTEIEAGSYDILPESMALSAAVEAETTVTEAAATETTVTEAEATETTVTEAEATETTVTEGNETTVTTVVPTTTAATETTYTVVEGDTLNKIANELGISVDALKAANELTSDNIFVGQTLKVPNANATETTTEAPASTTIGVSSVTSVEALSTTVDGKALPKTGERSANIVAIIAFMLVGVSIALLTFNKKDKENQV